MNKSKSLISIFLMALVLVYSAQGQELKKPEVVVVNFTEANLNLDWNEALNCLHPDMVKDLQNQIINIIKKCKKSDAHEVLSDFGVDELEELERMSPKEFYLKNQNRYIRDARPDSKLWKNSKYQITDSKLLSEDEYLVWISCTLDVNGKVKERQSVYTLKLNENKWKIIKAINQDN